MFTKATIKRKSIDNKTCNLVIINNLAVNDFDEVNNFVKQIKINNLENNNYPFFNH